MLLPQTAEYALRATIHIAAVAISRTISVPIRYTASETLSCNRPDVTTCMSLKSEAADYSLPPGSPGAFRVEASRAALLTSRANGARSAHRR